METVACDNCGSVSHEVIFNATGWHQPVLDGCTLVRCSNCGLLYLSPRPMPAEIGAFYTSSYAPYKKAVEDEPRRLMRIIRKRNLVHQRRSVEKYTGLKGGRLLDVGCSTGLFLHEMQQAGWETRGVEITASVAEYARERFGLDIFTGTLQETSFPEHSFDVITFWDVLEHTFSPSAELSLASKLLKPGGWLIINIPNYHSLDRTLFGPHWIGYDPPRHLYVFTQATLTAMLSRAGFQPVIWVCLISSYYSSILSFISWLDYHIHPLAPVMSRILNFPGMRFLFEPYYALLNGLHLGGVIAVIARNKTNP